MKKIMKVVGVFLLALLACGLLMVTIIGFIDLNRFKPLIIAKFNAATGYHLVIDGNLSWSLLPQVGLKAGQLSLFEASPAKAKQQNKLAEASSMIIGIKLKPLLHKQIQLDTLSAEGVKIRLKNTSLKLELAFSAKGSIDLPHNTLRLDEIHGELNKVKLSGHLLFAGKKSKPQTTGHLEIQSADFKKSLEFTGLKIPALTTLGKLKGSFDFSAGSSLSSVNLNGKLRIEELKTAFLSATNISTPLRLNKGNLTLPSLTADFYQGSLQGEAQFNFNKIVPTFDFQAQLRNMESAALLADLLGNNSKVKFSGKGDLNLQLSTWGAGADSLIKNLKGVGDLSFKNGSIKGMDMLYLVYTAYALANHQVLPTKTTNATQFNSFTGTFVVNNGVIHNNDLKLVAPLLNAQGKGSVNLVSRSINYRVEASTSEKALNLAQEGLISNLLGFVAPQSHLIKGLSIPIMITGSLEKPHIFLDMKTVIAELAKQQLKNAAIKSLGSGVLEIIPGAQVLPFLQGFSSPSP